MLIECPECHGAHTAPKYPGVGGCDRCRGNGVIEMKKSVDSPEQFRAKAKKMAEQFDPKGAKALELWKRLFEWTIVPYEFFYNSDRQFCFFCGSWKDRPHTSDCIWVEAKKLVDEK